MPAAAAAPAGPAREIRINLCVPVTRVGFGVFSIDPLEHDVPMDGIVTESGAVRHDRGDHDLEPLRARVEALRERMHEAARQASAQRTAAEDAARAFWSAYAEHAAGGADTTAFWTAGLD